MRYVSTCVGARVVGRVTGIAAMRIIFTRIGCTLLTCDMYMSDLRHIHDPVLSSLKMDSIRLLFLNLCETARGPVNSFS
jgi:hypothetical protein